MTPKTLTRLGELLYGPRFATSLAEALSDDDHRAQVSHVSAWCAEKRPIPAWVAARARGLATRGQRDLAGRLIELGELLSHPTALHSAPKALRTSRIAHLKRTPPDTDEGGPPEEPIP